MATHAPPERYGRLVDIGGRRLCARVHAGDSPTVVFENGAGSPSLVWAPVEARLTSGVATVAYDRAGIGWSERAAGRRSGDAIVEDLRRLLDAVDAPPPYVLVAHSAGALYARLFQAAHPGAVAGMVFVDAVDGDTYQLARRELRPRERILAEASHRVLPPVMALADRVGLSGALARRSAPPASIAADADLVEARREFWTGRNRLAGSRVEGHRLEETADVVSRLGRLDDLPVAVVRAGETLGVFGRIQQTWSETQERLAALSSRSVLVTAEGAGHFVQLDRPDVVAEAVDQIVGVVRSHAQPRRDGSA